MGTHLTTVSCEMLPATRHCEHAHLNPSQAGQYYRHSIYLPQSDGRLS